MIPIMAGIRPDLPSPSTSQEIRKMPAALAPARAAAPLLFVVAPLLAAVLPARSGAAPAPGREPAQEPTLTGFTAARAVTQLACEARFLDLPRAESFREHLRTITEHPHPAGSAAQVRVGDYLAGAMEQAGLGGRCTS